MRNGWAAAAMAEVKETLDAKVTEDEGGQRRLNQYLIDRVLGSGSFGTVHLGHDTDTDTKVAIKEFSKTKLRKQQAIKSGAFYGAFRGRGRGRGRGSGPPGGSHAAVEAARAAMLASGASSISAASSVASPSALSPLSPLGILPSPASHASTSSTSSSSENSLDLVRGEIAILKKLKHRNVVKLFEVLDDPNQDSLFMVFELCERGALIDVNLDHTAPPLAIDVARKYFREIILGIEYLHEHDIAHRDIKPDNMLISKDGTLKIVDFGVSEMFTKESGTVAKSAGSPAFYAPEMCIARHGDIKAKAVDIWAIGVTLYCMVYGRLPLVGSTILDLYESIRSKQPEYPPDIDPLLHDLFTRLLDKNPETRITMEQLRMHPWVTSNGADPLMSKQENCAALVLEVTQSEVDAAVKPVKSLFTVLKAVSKLKNLGKTVQSSDGINSASFSRLSVS